MMMVKKSYHTSASLGLPQAWTSTKMTRPYFDPVLKSKELINYSHTLNLTSSILTIDLKPGERKLGCIPYSQPHAWRPVKTNKMFWETLKHTTSKCKCLWVGHNSMSGQKKKIYEVEIWTWWSLGSSVPLWTVWPQPVATHLWEKYKSSLSQIRNWVRHWWDCPLWWSQDKP